MTIELETSQTIAAPVARVFAAWVDPDQMAGYFISHGSAPLQAGRTVQWTWDDHGGASLDITVTQLEPDEQLRFSWPATGTPTEVEVDFRSPSEGVTEITVRERGWPLSVEGVAAYGQQMQGWANMLACLKAYLEHWEINLREVPTQHHALTLTHASAASASVLYEAFTTGWDRWFAAPGAAAMTAEVGAPYWFEAVGPGERRYAHHGRFLGLEPQRRVELTWSTVATRGEETRLRIELEPVSEGTRVHLTHEGFTDRGAMLGHRRNWPLGLEHLDRVLAATD